MKIYHMETLPKLVILLLCTALIIFTNYVFLKKVSLDLKKEIVELEYSKIWWRDNYMILKELQKQEMLSYLDKLKAEQPELIYKLRQKALSDDIEAKNKQILTWEAVKELKETSYIKWNSWALVSIIEFSDMECSYCIEFHNSEVLNNILKTHKDNINYSFKNIPSPSYINARKKAKAAKCIEKISSWEQYLNFIDKIFKNSSPDLYNIDNIQNLVTELKLNSSDFNTCYSSKENENLVENEITQWKKLKITYTPSFVIINNKTWEYQVIVWKTNETVFNETINKFLPEEIKE